MYGVRAARRSALRAWPLVLFKYLYQYHSYNQIVLIFPSCARSRMRTRAVDRTRGYVARDADGEAAQRTRRESLNPYAARARAAWIVNFCLKVKRHVI